jgi:hypothetical protein
VAMMGSSADLQVEFDNYNVLQKIFLIG